MPANVNEHLVVSPKEGFGGDLEFYQNADGNIFIQSLSEEYPQFWFTITLEDWESIKEFIDRQLSG